MQISYYLVVLAESWPCRELMLSDLVMRNLREEREKGELLGLSNYTAP